MQSRIYVTLLRMDQAPRKAPVRQWSGLRRTPGSAFVAVGGGLDLIPL